MKQKRFYTYVGIIIIVWVILAIIFGIYDLQISIFWVNEGSLWGNFGADYGEYPGYAFIALGLSAYVGGYIKNLKAQKIPAYLAILYGAVMLFISLLDLNLRKIIEYLMIILSVVIFIIMNWNTDLRKYRRVSGIISFLGIINPLLFVQLVKIFWGRVRFRDLLVGYSNFSPWFIPQGITGNASFPSGHAAMGWMFLPLLVVVRKRHWKDPIKLLTIILVFGWGIFVGLSRIVVGAHYASDVLFSTGVAAITTLLLYHRFFLKKEN
ncbi:MAG: phosphatase PAP2 family protein [Promethearchaeota archaeon]|nr:MAG: phosphatase PAP2 family protein [Candidatus Lokiarchaeota archaeon]